MENYMFFKINTKENLRNELAKANLNINVLKDKISELENNLDDYKKGIETQVEEFPVAVNFKKINAFSIERLFNITTKQFTTIIGCYVNNELKEWFLHCNDNMHEILVNEFNKYKKNNPKKTPPANNIFCSRGCKLCQ